VDVVILDLQMPGMTGLEVARLIVADRATASLPLVMVTGFAERCHEVEARRSGIAAYLLKPVSQAKLQETIERVVDDARRASAGTEAASDAAPVQPSEAAAAVDAPLPPRARILLAEDDPTNRKVAVRTLERLGYQADTAANGIEVVAALERQAYDLVLMDCQMPDMDGFAAAAEIRRREGAARHTPIIAMTASAMQGDRERCLAVGMDDYVSKPVKPAALDAVLRLWLPDEPSRAAS
jgi:CheY-like chemotaxis protein